MNNINVDFKNVEIVNAFLELDFENTFHAYRDCFKIFSTEVLYEINVCKSKQIVITQMLKRVNELKMKNGYSLSTLKFGLTRMKIYNGNLNQIPTKLKMEYKPPKKGMATILFSSYFKCFCLVVNIVKCRKTAHAPKVSKSHFGGNIIVFWE